MSDPRDLANQWLQTPGMQDGMKVIARLRKDGVPTDAALAADAVALELLTGWLAAWGESNDPNLKVRVYLEAIRITKVIEGM